MAGAARRDFDAVHVLVHRRDVTGFQGIRPVCAYRPLLLLRRGVLVDDHLRRLNLGAAFERHLGLAVFLQLPEPRWREWYRVVEL